MDQTPMTPRGEDLLRKELQRLKTVERPRIVAAIAEARSHGDLSENAEYDAAKEEQGLCEARIKDIEGKLASANVIDVSKLKTPNGGKLKVIFGATVTVVDVATVVSLSVSTSTIVTVVTQITFSLPQFGFFKLYKMLTFALASLSSMSLILSSQQPCSSFDS